MISFDLCSLVILVSLEFIWKVLLYIANLIIMVIMLNSWIPFR